MVQDSSEMRPPKFDADEPVLVSCFEGDALTLAVDYPVGDEPFQFQW